MSQGRGLNDTNLAKPPSGLDSRQTPQLEQRDKTSDGGGTIQTITTDKKEAIRVEIASGSGRVRNQQN